MEPLSLVYVTNANPHQDTRLAEGYGKVVNLTEGTVNPFAPDRVQEQIRSGLEGFRSATDWLLVSGAALAIGFAFASLPKGPTRLLLWDVKTRKYIERTVTL